MPPCRQSIAYELHKRTPTNTRTKITYIHVAPAALQLYTNKNYNHPISQPASMQDMATYASGVARCVGTKHADKCTHIRTHPLFPSRTHAHTFSLSLSLSQTHTHTHTLHTNKRPEQTSAQRANSLSSLLPLPACLIREMIYLPIWVVMLHILKVA